MRDVTEIVIILDESGSMSTKVNDVIGGFNKFISEQKKVPGEANVTLATFNSPGTYEQVFSRKPLINVEELNTKTYSPGGMTALLDAVGRTIDYEGECLRNIDEPQRPDKIMFIIITDGEENSSTEYKKSRILEMIEHQTEVYKWQFIYLGANQDAFSEAASMGIPTINALNYVADQKGFVSAYSSMSECVSSYRSTGSYTVKDKDDRNTSATWTTKK